MTILTHGYGQTDQPTDRQTLLPIELLSQLKIDQFLENIWAILRRKKLIVSDSGKMKSVPGLE